MTTSPSVAGRTALFVVDIQKDMAAEPKTRIPHADRIVHAGTTILKQARALHGNTGTTPPPLLVFVQHEEPPESGSLVRGSEPWQLVFPPRENVADEMLVAKTTPDTFESNPDLTDKLRAAGVNDIVIFGIQSDCCVQATTTGALASGFNVTVLAGAHSTYDDGGKTAEQIEHEIDADLRRKGARIVAWEDAVARWTEDGALRA